MDFSTPPDLQMPRELGGAGLSFRERAARIYDGPDEVHKSALARRILKSHGLKLGGEG